MTLTNRLSKLEAKHAPKVAPRIFMYYHNEQGYAASAIGPYFATLGELDAARGWDRSGEADVNLVVVRASERVRVYIPDNGREDVQP